ncbi:MAG TPA: hypothetical protein VGO68_06795 [Pyrinomonadaceae bacterium]|jgi:hypothetical protein|nr:hypothetical protein [Pyrinomonadaceae bacterium]
MPVLPISANLAEIGSPRRAVIANMPAGSAINSRTKEAYFIKLLLRFETGLASWGAAMLLG